MNVQAWACGGRPVTRSPARNDGPWSVTLVEVVMVAVIVAAVTVVVAMMVAVVVMVAMMAVVMEAGWEESVRVAR